MIKENDFAITFDERAGILTAKKDVWILA